ncbi:GDP-mannose 4,6-dehydratase [Streptomyces sp. NBC_01275]|uniref:GDP-mannose 4,6-dehydratase n=1 Tax=Streptomyces sp. NBC_01275 TaxID=2903807 RepID=UPI00225C2E91|nr:GDP-mannose 4,6-dehydratase [Streptomyces sp. NBC_01275]MCX4763823.1 GDP-mannose 4,6-dehydratase [Streptomyces sp. NBC_01275]
MRALVTGGAGFIGCNLTAALVRGGHEVTVVDNLSRPGSLRNLQVLLEDPVAAQKVSFHPVDVRDADGLAAVVADHRPDAVAHLAGQVAVTDSVTHPLVDFDINARGTLHVLEAVRRHAPEARVLFTSTNKVYGGLKQHRTERTPTRYVLPDHPDGVSESFPTLAATPYGCSKLTADLYVQDYAATYSMATTVFRMSCIYGKWQNGTVDQGWVSWLVKSALLGNPITIYGDGLQVRDLLHVDDLIAAVLSVLEDGRGAGEVFNIGGGVDYSLSIWAEFGALLAELAAGEPPVTYEPWRTGDQHVYISDIAKAREQLGWRPRRAPRDGIAEMTEWLRIEQKRSR